MSEHTHRQDSPVERITEAVVTEVGTVIVGKDALIRDVIAAFLSRGHVLFEDVPGLGKTMLAQSVAACLGLEYRRLQCTPDLLPGDITGGYMLNPETGQFELRRGPVFTNILLADEINRASPKTQSALLQAMQEGEVSIEGSTFQLPQPFFVMATQNPVEYEGTFPLPEAQLDRFIMKTGVGYPDRDEENRILRNRMNRKSDAVEISCAVAGHSLQDAFTEVESVHVSDDLSRYIVDLVAATRGDRGVAVGASPRGSLALLKLARARASQLGRDFVLPDDVTYFAQAALVHRIVLSPDLWTRPNAAERIVAQCMQSVPVPVSQS
ncbi:MAG: MoxR family ATPase [Spirochaetaceae bacterium]|nr:MAG: MoxR family ATPase [Spirochaetaceae bacterium]